MTNSIKRIKKQVTVWEKENLLKHISDKNIGLKYTANKKYVR